MRRNRAVVLSFHLHFASRSRGPTMSLRERRGAVPQCEEVPSISRSLWDLRITTPIDSPPITVKIASVSISRSKLTCLGTDNKKHPTLSRAQKTGYQGRFRRASQCPSLPSCVPGRQFPCTPRAQENQDKTHSNYCYAPDKSSIIPCQWDSR